MSQFPLKRFQKAPAEVLNYGCDFTKSLTAKPNNTLSDTLASAVWTVPPGITVTDEQITNTMAIIELSGGTLGQVYTITCTGTTANGFVAVKSFELQIATK